MTIPDDDAGRNARPDGAGDRAAAVAPEPAHARSVWTRPVSYRAQCWIAWSGLTAFATRGAWAWRTDGAMAPEQLVACVLAVCWGIDLLRARSLER